MRGPPPPVAYPHSRTPPLIHKMWIICLFFFNPSLSVYRRNSQRCTDGWTVIRVKSSCCTVHLRRKSGQLKVDSWLKFLIVKSTEEYTLRWNNVLNVLHVYSTVQSSVYSTVQYSVYRSQSGLPEVD